MSLNNLKPDDMEGSQNSTLTKQQPVETKDDPTDSFDDALESKGLPRHVMLKLLESWENECINL